MMVRQTPVSVKEVRVSIRAVDNKGNTVLSVDNAYAVQIVLKIYADDFKINYANSHVIVDRVYTFGLREVLRYNIADAIDSVFIIEDVQYFPHRYEIKIVEKGVAVDGYIRYW